jgi:predicted Ser/Thr protein kinase
MWVDRQLGVVFKQFCDEASFHREVGFLKRLEGFPCAPKVLGTTSQDQIWGVFMRHEGHPVTGGWEEVRDFIEMCIRELHIMGIHHHDVAQRNVLQRPDRLFVLIDFDNVVDAKDCLDDECPDKYPETEFL